MSDRPYLRSDAFVVMRYRALDDAAEVEEVWNSRDGLAPYSILLKSGRVATHVDWTSMVHRPDYTPPPGSRVIVDLTEAIATEKANAYARKIWDDKGAEGMLARHQYKTVEDMITVLTANIRPGEPTLVDVPEEGWKR
jgi:hypothetical protein